MAGKSQGPACLFDRPDSNLVQTVESNQNWYYWNYKNSFDSKPKP